MSGSRKWLRLDRTRWRHGHWYVLSLVTDASSLRAPSAWLQLSWPRQLQPGQSGWFLAVTGCQAIHESPGDPVTRWVDGQRCLSMFSDISFLPPHTSKRAADSFHLHRSAIFTQPVLITADVRQTEFIKKYAVEAEWNYRPQ